MSGRDTRPVRTLAAWGYESDTTGTRIEVDVWTVNEAEATRSDARERAEAAIGGRGEVLEAYGNVAKVAYAGAAGTGYRYIDPDATNPGIEGPTATQQAFAGAKRSAGGDRDDQGRIGEGFETPPDAPGIEECAAFGAAEVIPAVREDLRRSGAREMAQALERIRRQPTRDEIEEPTNERPFAGFDNAVRIFPRGGREFEYSVDVNRETLR
jgi:hypothetical protein